MSNFKKFAMEGTGGWHGGWGLDSYLADQGSNPRSGSFLTFPNFFPLVKFKKRGGAVGGVVVKAVEHPHDDSSWVLDLASWFLSLSSLSGLFLFNFQRKNNDDSE